jgi:hypothetical protein
LQAGTFVERVLVTVQHFSMHFDKHAAPEEVGRHELLSLTRAPTIFLPCLTRRVAGAIVGILPSRWWHSLAVGYVEYESGAERRIRAAVAKKPMRTCIGAIKRKVLTFFNPAGDDAWRRPRRHRRPRH